MPDVQDPDKRKSGDEIRLENSAHDGDCFDLVYENGISVHHTGPGGVEGI